MSAGKRRVPEVLTPCPYTGFELCRNCAGTEFKVSMGATMPELPRGRMTYSRPVAPYIRTIADRRTKSRKAADGSPSPSLRKAREKVPSLQFKHAIGMNCGKQADKSNRQMAHTPWQASSGTKQ